MSTALDASFDDLEIIRPAYFQKHGYPHDAWRRLRAEAPVAHWDRFDLPFWAITKHADITAIGQRPDLFLSAPQIVMTKPRVREFDPPPTVIEMDPPDHGPFRQIVSRRFTPRALRRIHADIDRIARRIVNDLLVEENPEVDFVERISAPLPIAVIAWLLGVPESDWELLFDWTNRTVGANDPDYRDPGTSSSQSAENALREIYQYFGELAEAKRKNPADDLITLFTQAEVNGRKLDPMEVLSYCQIILVAGNETTRNATSGGMLNLIEHPEALRRIQADPSLLKPAIEEILRFDSPIIHFGRTATQDTEVRGQKIRKGEHLALFYPSANRDEEVFDRPDEFIIDRKPNRHLAFGIGEHFCAGAHVARLEMEMAFKYLIPRIENVELTGEPRRLRSNFVGGIKELPVRFSFKPAA